MMLRLVSAACGAILLTSAAMQAEPVVVVELFTSQGCVSCPPADEFFASLTEDSRLIPLSLHVDYWDYIGWSDVFGSPRFTERQKNYARAIGSRTIYTPQFIIGGEDRIEGFDPAATTEALLRQLATPTTVALSVNRAGERLHIEAQSAQPLAAPVRVQLVRYLPEETVTIERGENAGKTISYRNIVTNWDVLGDWAGTAPLNIEVPAPGSAPAVVILQQIGPSEILAAARADGVQGSAEPLYVPSDLGIGFLSRDTDAVADKAMRGGASANGPANGQATGADAGSTQPSGDTATTP